MFFEYYHTTINQYVLSLFSLSLEHMSIYLHQTFEYTQYPSLHRFNRIYFWLCFHPSIEQRDMLNMYHFHQHSNVSQTKSTTQCHQPTMQECGNVPLYMHITFYCIYIEFRYSQKILRCPCQFLSLSLFFSLARLLSLIPFSPLFQSPV